MEHATCRATSKTSLFRCTVALGLLVSLAIPIVWPSSAIAQESSPLTAPVSFTFQTSSASDALSPLRSQTAQEDSSTRAHPSVSGAARKARYADSSLPRASRPWVPPDVDDGVPSVAPGVACSLPEVLQGAGQ